MYEKIKNRKRVATIEHGLQRNCNGRLLKIYVYVKK